MREMNRIKKTNITLARNWWDEGINLVTGYRISPRKKSKNINPDELKYFNAYPTLNIKQ
tara:strand:+ start:1056 stop:1232 length:177 start_codon:yes stop_codon:yes gene_type:complete